jgi:hypothetical protein
MGMGVVWRRKERIVDMVVVLEKGWAEGGGGGGSGGERESYHSKH